MARKTYDEQIKRRAEELRKAGKTYAEIRKELPVAKSTLSLWLGEKYKGVFDRKAQLAHLKKIRVAALHTIRTGKIERTSVAMKKGEEVAHRLPLKDTDVLKALLAMMYWAEGSKHATVSGIRFANTDPRFAFLYVSLVRKCFPVDESRFRIRLHVHYYHEKKKTVRFWSKLLNVPPSQFWKVYVKKRSKKKRFRKNSMGICFIYYPENAFRNELLGLGYTIHDILSNHILP